MYNEIAQENVSRFYAEVVTAWYIIGLRNNGSKENNMNSALRHFRMAVGAFQWFTDESDADNREQLSIVMLTLPESKNYLPEP